MLFITNRVLVEGMTPMMENAPQLPRTVSFDLANNQAEQSVYLCDRNGADDYTEIGNQAFFTQLKNSVVKEILIFVRGYPFIPILFSEFFEIKFTDA